MSFNTHRIYDSVIISSGWTSQIVSATTISAGTYYGGSLSASFIGNQNVTNQEFRYNSGVTSDVQTQIDEKYFKNYTFLTNSGNTTLTNEKILTLTNLSSSTLNNEITISFPLKSLVLTPLYIDLSIVSPNLINWNPSGYNESINTKSANFFVRHLNTNFTCTIISGIEGGVDGKTIMITNVGAGIVIIENLSSKCNPLNKIKTSLNEAIFLTNYRSTTLVYSDNDKSWIEIKSYDGDNQFDIFEDFISTPITFRCTSGPGSGCLSRTNSNLQLFTSNTAGVVSTVTSHLDSNHVFLTQNGTTLSTSISGFALRPQRLESNSTILVLGKISLISETWETGNLRFALGTTTEIRTGNLSPWVSSSNYTGWATPTDTSIDKSVFYFIDGFVSTSSISATDLKLSSCTNNWCYLGYNYDGRNAGGKSIFYSFDNNEYQLAYQASLGATAFNLAGMTLRTYSSSTVNGFYVDNIGINSFFYR